MIDDSEPFALTGVVVVEILQGLTKNARRIEDFLSLWDLLDPRGFSTYREAATIFRLARSKGIALTTIDTLIAAVAMEYRTSLFTLDKDISRIARFTSLRLYTFPEPLA